MALDVAPATVRKGQTVDIGRSSGGLGSIQGLQTVTYGNESIVVNSWSDTLVNVTVPAGIALANSDTGYKFRIDTLGVLGVQESALVPLQPTEGYEYVVASSPVIDGGSILRDFGFTVADGNQIVFQSYPGLTVSANSQFSFSPEPTGIVSIPYVVITSNGTIVGEATFDYDPSAPLTPVDLTQRADRRIDIDYTGIAGQNISTGLDG